MQPIERVLSALREHGKNPKQSGKGWIALCPAHDDHNPSLSISEGQDGKVLLNCFSHNCQAEKITEAIGLKVGDLFCEREPTRRATKPRTAKGSTSKPTSKEPESATEIFPTADAAFSYLRKKHQIYNPDIWKYLDAVGEVVAYALRFDPKRNPKFFQPVFRQGEGWVVKAPPAPRPLYNLPKVIASEGPILFVEGEKCADIAKRLGFISTTTFGGANAPQLTDLKPLEGKEVWILPDNDKAGNVYVQKLLTLLSQFQNRPKVKVVFLPDLREGEDLEQFRDICRRQGMDNEATRQDILTMGNQTPFYEWPPQSEARIEAVCQAINGGTPPSKIGVLTTIRASDVKIRPIKWLWKHYIPFGVLTLVSGLPKQGKSQIACNLAAIASKGGILPDGSTSPKCEILYCSAEDNSEEVLTPRFMANQADLNAIHFPQGVTTLKNRDEGETQLNEADLNATEQEYWNLLNIPALEDCLNQNPNIRIVVIDPIGSFIGGDTNTYRDNEVRAVLEPLKKLAQEKQLAVLLICHIGKSRHPNADQNILGSTAFHGLARGSLHVQPDNDDPDMKLFLSGNVNLCKTPPAWKVWFEDVEFPSEEGVIETSQVCWSKEPIEGIGADDYYRLEANEFARRGPKPNKLEEAKNWIQTFLADGPKLQKLIETEAKKVDISESTLKRAKKEIDCKSYPKGGVWYWSLAQEHKQPELLEPLDEKALEISTNLQEDQQGENLNPLKEDQVSPTTEIGCLPNCQEEQATETDDTPSPFAGRNLFEEFPDQRLPD